MRTKKQKLKRRADGRYRCKYNGHDFYGNTSDEALAKREEYKMLEKGQIYISQTFSGYADQWLKAYKSHLTPAPYSAHKKNIEKWISINGDRLLSDYTPSNVSLYYQSFNKMSTSTIHSARDTIKGIFKAAVADGYLLKDPAANVPVPKGTKGTHRAITDEERELIHNTDHRLKPAVMTMLYAGLRRGEAMALNVDRDVDFKNKTITVREAVRFESGWKPVVVSPKTEAGNRTIPLLDILADELKDKHGLICVSVNGKMMTESAWARAWDSYLYALGEKKNGCSKRWAKKPWIPVDIRPHDLRHSFCTYLYDAGVDLKTAMLWMGHADQTMTMQIYTHLTNLRKLEAEEKLRLFSNNKTKEENAMKMIRFIDLFAGIGGIRKGFELACKEHNIKSKCVFTSEIKPYAVDVLRQNHPDEVVTGDITKVHARDIPDFEVLLAGFPCQAFSAAGKRLGFEDTRGTLFFDVARIIKEKQPLGFVLENVEGLVNHNREDTKAPIGRTLQTILNTLDELGYKVNWRVLNAKDFGIPQDRKRIYIIGTKTDAPNLDEFVPQSAALENILDCGLPVSDHPFVLRLLACYGIKDLVGKAIKDKRGGEENIHSWDIELKGAVSQKQKKLLSMMMTERRKKKWAEQYGIDWMDGMPLTFDMIRSFWGDDPELYDMLEDLTNKKYVVKEHPKRRLDNGLREQDESLPIGYNIVAGKMSYEVAKILDPKDVAPTLVAMDMLHLYVPDGDGIRRLSLREGLRLFGYPEDFKFNVNQSEGYDLLGNTVCVPVIQAVSSRLLNVIEGEIENADSTTNL